MKIKNIEIKNKVILAPLAGYSNISYRRIMREMGVGLVYSEMISSRGLVYENDKTFELTKTIESDHPISMQLFGGDIESLVRAAKIIDKETDADIIDINMGCPVRKVLKANSGCYLLQNPIFIREVVSEIVQSVSKPVSVKIRAGWDHSSINVVEVGKAIERAGASLIAIHGRTRSDMYTGNVNLEYIKTLKENVGIPVIGNGDIKSVEDAINMIDYTNVDMIMVGRASLGNPWLIRDLVNYFENKPLQAPATSLEKLKMCKKHFEYLLEEKHEKIAVLEMRGLANFYIKGIKNMKKFKQRLINVDRKEDLFNILFEIKEEIINNEN